MSVLQVKPRFLYPHSRQFPFDEVAQKIVEALEVRNWNVPGITVKFDTYGSGEAKYKMVREIRGENFKLRFSRNQGHLDGQWLDNAALSEICIPKEIIGVYEDESGPTYYLYVGKNWDKDREWFMNTIKVNSRMNGEPRRYLRYSGNTYRSRSQELVSDNDFGREYSPMGNEPQRIILEQKFGEFTTWLERNVLEYILKFSEEKISVETAPKLIPYEGPWKTVFSLCNDQAEIYRILWGKKNSKSLSVEKRHAYFGSGPRLVSLGTKYKEAVPEIAYEGFIWCDVNQDITKETCQLEIMPSVHTAMGSRFWDNYLVAVRLKYANDVYVVDDAIYDEVRKKIFKAVEPRDHLTNAELDKAIAARGMTIVPITEYKGDYKEPIVLIGRELDFDEIEWISKMK